MEDTAEEESPVLGCGNWEGNHCENGVKRKIDGRKGENVVKRGWRQEAVNESMHFLDWEHVYQNVN